MNIQKFILNLFPEYHRIKKLHAARDADSKQLHAVTCSLRGELNTVHSLVRESRTEANKLRRELQAEKLRNELPRVFLTKGQILKLMAHPGIDPAIQNELVNAYENYVRQEAHYDNTNKPA